MAPPRDGVDHRPNRGIGMRVSVRRLLVPLSVVALIATGCGRSGDDKESSGDKTTTTQAATAAAPGDFGSLKAVCGPGDAKGATARGVTDTEIDISTFSDTGAQVQPGLNQELFDTGDAFVKW